MNVHSRTFTDKPAVRSHVPLWVGITGPSGGGKTFSALRLATGIQQITGGEIYYIDTEAKRALHYADRFKFRHVEFTAPFGSLDYLEAVKHCVSKGGKVIVIDSMSHEHIGPGGYLLTQEAELDRMAGNDYAKRERVKMAAWIKPAGLRQRMITGLLQQEANLIFCYRAKERTKPVPGPDGKMKIVEMGYMPIGGEELIFEMTVNCLLLPQANGVPTWQSENVGERAMMKLPEQFKGIFAENKSLDESIGKQLAEWAKGGNAPENKAASAPESRTDSAMDEKLIEETLELARTAARGGSDVFTTFWKGCSHEQRQIARRIEAELKLLRAESDKRQAEAEADPL